MDEPLLGNAARGKASVLLQPHPFESLDYEIVDNELYKQNWRLASKRDIIQHTISKWILAFSVGVATALVSLFINVAVENIAGTRFLFTLKLMSKQRFTWAFLVYTGSNITLVLFSALLCIFIAPAAVGSGVPDVEAYLNGIDCSPVLSVKTFVVKLLGIIATLSSGLMAGKAGPLIHMSACIAHAFSRPGLFHRLLRLKHLDSLDNDKHRQDLVTCGTAAGLAAAFRAPIGGVLFAMEEISSWWRSSLLWRSFFTTAVVALVLRMGIYWCSHGHCGSYGKGGLILFDVSDTPAEYGLLEIVPVAILGILGGALGSLYNHLHLNFFLFNTRWQAKNGVVKKCLHALVAALITSICSFGLPWLATCRKCPEGDNVCPTYKHPGNYKAFNCPAGYYNDMAGLLFSTTEDAIRNLFSVGTPSEFSVRTLLTATCSSYLLALMTYGVLVPSGLFIPAILCGATYGRLVGKLTVSFGLHRLDESMYAVIGAASFVGGSMRIPVSLCVVVLELTNNLMLLPLVMLVLLISKVVGDYFNKGIFKLHIDIKGYHFLKDAPPMFMTQLVAGDVVNGPPVTLFREERVGRVLQVLSSCACNAFPVLERLPNGQDGLYGLVLRAHVLTLLQMKAPPSTRSEDTLVDLAPVVNRSPYTVAETMPLSKAYSLFRQLALRHLCVVPKNLEGPPVVGLLTRHDFMQASLCEKHPHVRESIHNNFSFQNVNFHSIVDILEEEDVNN